MAFEYTSLVIIAVAAVILGTYRVHANLSYTDAPPNLPWVGVREGTFAPLRTRLASLNGMLETLEGGYKKYSRSGLSFILPGFDRSMVLIPGSQVKWISEQADNVLNAKEMQRDVLQTSWTFLDRTLVDDPIHEVIVRRDLTRNLGSLIPDIEEELDVGIAHYWGRDTEHWTDINVFGSMLNVVARTSNRIFVGLPLCRNEEYLYNAGMFAQDIGVSAALLRMLPSFLRSIFGWLLVLPNRWHSYKCCKHLVPFIRQRMADLDDAERTGASKEQWNDFTTWYLKEVADHPDASERSVIKVARRLMTINFAAIHTSTFTATNILFDLYSSTTAASDVAEIRQEIAQVLLESGGKWDKNAVAKLVKTDSAIRESLRISTFMSHGMDRLVVDPKGVMTQDGLHLPQGTRIGTATHSIHHDDSVYEKAMAYDAFRFSRAREAVDKASDGQGEAKKNLARVLESKNLSTVTTSETFLSFGHGRHACPGRFFAALEMKLLVAYVVMNYDVKALLERPPNVFVGGSILPPMKATISVRRRKS